MNNINNGRLFCTERPSVTDSINPITGPTIGDFVDARIP